MSDLIDLSYVARKPVFGLSVKVIIQNTEVNQRLEIPSMETSCIIHTKR